MIRLRWMLMGLAVGCLAFFAQPGQANAAVHHARSHAPRHATLHRTHHAAQSRAPRPERRAPIRNSSRATNHARPHSGKNRFRHHASSHATGSTASLDQSLIRSRLALALAGSHDLNRSRTLESRGPPRASPDPLLAQTGLNPPPIRVTLQLRDSSAATVTDPINRVSAFDIASGRPATASAASSGSPHAVRLEGAAACHMMPSSGGVSV